MQQFCAYFSLFEMKYFRFAAKCLSKSIKKEGSFIRQCPNFPQG